MSDSEKVKSQTDYKETLNLPKTGFPMKANLFEREPAMIKFWEDEKIYEQIQEARKGSEHYILHDGPPYANGHIHIGHALNKILKDIIIKYKSMQGYYTPYVPGWDCHGLPIELQVDKNLGSKKESIDILEKRRLCKEYAAKFVKVQKDEFKRLGVLGDWDRPYLTMSYSYEATIVKEFCRFVEAGYVYKGKKPVYWCPSCVTALAEAEVEYGDKESPSIYVMFNISDTKLKERFPILTDKNVSIIIWTTTPWTLPANLALAVHQDYDYVAFETEKGVYIIAEELLDNLIEKLKLNGNIIERFKGRRLEGINADHPFIERKSRILLGDFVSVEEGTGVVHIAPGHGEEDYEVGLRHGLDIYAPVDDHGRFRFSGDEKALSIEGKFVFKANKDIIEILKSKDALLLEETVTHSYPHCWRCKKPVIFRATEQWFISMEMNRLRERALLEIERVAWIPKWGKERIYGMVLNRPDWCISRQRAWGVPITLIRCNGCGEFVTDSDVLQNIISMVKEHGADVWFIKDAEDILPDGYSCKKCGGNSFSKELDILDVWFDSGVSHVAVMEIDDRLFWPADMYLEGSDQHRGWFQSSLLASVGTRNKAPFKTVLTHGFVVDGQGKKMSKSLGNVIAPQEVIKKNGAEILRLWVSAEDYKDDIRISREILERLTEAYRKIRNTCRFLLGNIYDFDGKDYSQNMLEIDKWAMSKLQTLIKKVNSAYEHFDFHEVFHDIYNFCIVDMSSFYLDVLKDRLYTFKSYSFERRAAQWVFCQILSAITRLMAPILSFTAEEVWQHIIQRQESWGQRKGEIKKSVFLAPFPEFNGEFYNPDLENRWNELFILRDEVNKAIELKRKERFIGNSLEAKIILNPPEKYRLILSQYTDFLPTFFIVSAVELTDRSLTDAYKSTEIEGLEIIIERAPGEKCQRCWNWSKFVGTFKDAPDICERCYRVIFGNG